MGESKKRGGKEDRVAQALGLQKKRLEDLIKELRLPEDTVFCGYLIHVVQSDEFIHSIEDTPIAIKRAFVRTPELAKRYDEFQDAYRYARYDKDEVVVALFDIGDMYQVARIY